MYIKHTTGNWEAAAFGTAPNRTPLDAGAIFWLFNLLSKFQMPVAIIEICRLPLGIRKLRTNCLFLKSVKHVLAMEMRAHERNPSKDLPRTAGFRKFQRSSSDRRTSEVPKIFLGTAGVRKFQRSSLDLPEFGSSKDHPLTAGLRKFQRSS